MTITFIKLQMKVPYHSQRDNISPTTEEDLNNNSWMNTYNVTTAGDIMCNLTSEAMCLEYLGIEAPCSDCSGCNTYTQFEDYMECIRVDKAFDNRGEGSTRKKLAELFDGVSYTYEDIQSSDQTDITLILKSYLENGCSVMLSAFGHMVRLQEITDTGLVVDDPYGKVVDFSASGCTAKYKKDGKDYRNDEDFTNKEGENNVWKWADLENNNLNIGYAEVYCKE